jgi:hypothetical protein
MEDIDPMLEKYEPGDVKMKPDVLKQIAEIEAERNRMMQAEAEKNGQIMLNEPGKPPVAMTMAQIADMLTKQGEQIRVYQERITELEGINLQLQKLLTTQKPSSSSSVPRPVLGESSKSVPLFQLDESMI